jgi:hypothetical protein
MIQRDLQNLDSTGIHQLSISISSPVSLHDRLDKLEAVEKVRERIREGSLGFDEIRIAISEWLRQLVRGTRLPSESAVSALAVAVEKIPGPDAEQFLKELAGLRILEMPIASRIAAVSLQQWKELFDGTTFASRVVARFPMPQGPIEEIPLRISIEHTDDEMRVA